MLGGTPAHLLNRFVLLPEAGLSMREDEQPVRDAVVFLYVDHECGTTVSLVSRASGRGDELQLHGQRYLGAEGAMIRLFRHGAFPLVGAQPLSDEQISKLGLEVPPSMAETYGFADHEWQRRDQRLDPFRSEAYPDDVRVLLPREDAEVEEIWVSLEAPFPTEDFEGFRGILLNQPFEPNSYVEIGDHVVLRLCDTEDDPVLVLVGKVHSE